MGACAYAAEGDAVDFLVFLEGIAGKLYADVAEDSAVVVGVVASVLGARTAFDLLTESAFIVAATTADDETSPVAGLTAAFGLG